MKLTKKQIDDLTKFIKNKEDKKEVKSILENVNYKKNINLKNITNEIKKIYENKPRYLTEKELNYVVSDIPLNTYCIKDVSESIREQIISKLKFSLKTFKFCEKGIDDLKNMITKLYYKSYINYGEPVGLYTAQAVGELFTQLNLNTFHSAGSIQTGGNSLDAINDLFKVSANKKYNSTKVHFIEKNMSKKNLSDLINTKILEVSLDDIVQEKFLVSDGKVEEKDKWWYHNSNLIYGTEIPESSIFFRIKLNSYLCKYHDISLEKIITSLNKLQMICVVAPLSIGYVDIYPNMKLLEDRSVLNKIKLNFSDKLKTNYTIGFILKDLVNKCFPKLILQGIKGVEEFNIKTINLLEKIKKVKNSDTNWTIYIDYFSLKLDGLSVEKYREFFTMNKKIKIVKENFEHRPFYVQLECKEDPIKLITDVKKEAEENLQKEIEYIKKNIDDLDNYEFDESENYLKCFYNFAECTGKNIISELMNHPLIDHKYTVPNNVREIFEYMGIESARLYFIREYVEIINSGKNFINPNNLELLVDYQTGYGKPIGINLLGVSGQGDSTLSDASFEQPMEAFRKVASMGKVDKLKGISGCIMSGKQMLTGTGIVQIEFDKNFETNESQYYENDDDEDQPLSLMEIKEFKISDYSKKDEEVDVTLSLDIKLDTFSVPFVSKLQLPAIIGINPPSLLSSLENNNPIKTITTKDITIPDAPSDFLGSSLF